MHLGWLAVWSGVLAATLTTIGNATSRQSAASYTLSPAEALNGFVVEPGYRIDLVAAEPLVQSPVAIAFDDRGFYVRTCAPVAWAKRRPLVWQDVQGWGPVTSPPPHV